MFKKIHNLISVSNVSIFNLENHQVLKLKHWQSIYLKVYGKKEPQGLISLSHQLVQAVTAKQFIRPFFIELKAKVKFTPKIQRMQS